MARRVPVWTLSLAGLLILVLLGGTVFGHAAGFSLAVCLPAALLELPARDLAAWQPAAEPHHAPLDVLLAASQGRAPPFLFA